MIQLKEVLHTFITHFNYLDKQNNQRQSPWYAFWYRNDYLKNTFTNLALTERIEAIVSKCTLILRAQEEKHGEKDFEEYKHHFCLWMEDMVHQVRIERFKHGRLETSQYHTGSTSILQRHIYSQRPGYFEAACIVGLKAVRDRFSDLNEIMSFMINTLSKSSVDPILVFEEEARGNAQSRRSFEQFTTSMGCDHEYLSTRERYAREELPRLQLSKYIKQNSKLRAVSI